MVGDGGGMRGNELGGGLGQVRINMSFFELPCELPCELP